MSGRDPNTAMAKLMCGLLLAVVVRVPSGAAAQDPSDESLIRAIIAEQATPAGIVVPPDGVIKTQLMEVLVRRGGQWWVEAYHNVDTKPAR